MRLTLLNYTIYNHTKLCLKLFFPNHNKKPFEARTTRADFTYLNKFVSEKNIYWKGKDEN